jgi:hypothetical protein
MSYIDTDLVTLTEVFQRRNIIIHNGGRVNSIYISKVHPSLRKDLPLNAELLVSPQYLAQSIDILELNMILICAELWEKVSPEDRARREILNSAALDHLKQERWAVGAGLSYFV